MWSIDLMEKVVNRTPVCGHLHYYWTMFPFNNVNNIRLFKKKPTKICLNRGNVLWLFWFTYHYRENGSLCCHQNAMLQLSLHLFSDFLFRLNHLWFNSSDYLIQSSKILSTLLLLFFILYISSHSLIIYYIVSTRLLRSFH